MAADRKLGASDFTPVIWVAVVLFMVTGCLVHCDENGKQRKYSMEELLTMTFPTKYSGDLDMDPCKAGGFMGDIAIPNVDYGERWNESKLNKTLQEEVERLKQEVLLEGLQVEEEGLTDILRKRTKHPADNEEDKSKYNDATLGVKGPIHSNLNTLKSQNLNPNAQSQISIASQNATTAKVDIISTQDNNLTTATPRSNATIQILEQDGVLAVNISKSNILQPEDLLAEIVTESSANKTKSPELQNEKLGKIQSNSREITGDANGNLQKKDVPASSVGPAPTNGILTEQRVTNKQQSDPVEPQRNSFGGIQNFKSLDSQELRSEESAVKSKQTKRRRRHGGKRWMTEEALSEERKKSEEALRSIRMSANLKPRQKKHKKHRKRPRKYAAAAFSGSKDKFEVPVHEFERKFEGVPQNKNAATRLNHANASAVLVAPRETINWTRYVRSSEDSMESSIADTQRRLRRAATGRKERIWENGIIPYEIDGNFSGAHKALFKQAMRHWENFTCVKFVERDLDEHVNYIVFTERTCGCCSFVGKRGNGAQAISIGKNCDKFGIVVHELGHVVGFWHEHTRPDRDRHVQIIRDNILTGQEYNFNKLTEEEVNSLGQTYDYDSIMHYARNTFSKGTYLDTILPLEVHGKRRPEIGQRVRLSESDIAQTNLLYKCAKCGRTLQESSGWFSSPGWSSGASNQAIPAEGDKCEWRITATHGERIILNITELDIQKSEGCSVEYLEVVDGYGPKASSLGRWCGSGRVPALRSSGARLTVLYRAVAADGLAVKDHRGFNAYYEAVCGGELDLEAGGHLESPNYPDDYQPNKECVWKLTVPEDYQVALKFQSFEVENHDSCIYDYVEVRDGHISDSPLIGVFCGYKIPPDIRSTSNKLLVKFVSDGSVQKAGFSAHFMKEHDECAVQTHGCQHECVNTLGGYECSCNIGYELKSDGKTCEDACGGILDDLNGTITSPSFPDAYPPSKSCLWEIVAPLRHRITLNFTHFDLEGNDVYQQECEYDAVTVHSVLVGGVLRRHGAWCGIRRPAPITSDGSALRITFTSDNSVHKSGFAAVYYIDMDECAVNNGGCQHECRNTLGGYECACHSGFNLHENRHDCKEGGCKHDVTQPHGTILSPNYPDVYPSSKDCVWHFTTTPGHRIKLLFNIFELEQHQECAYDHVTIYDGENADAHTLGRFCGSKPPHPIIASHNQMYVVFKSDASVQRKGFIATHSTACGGHLMASARPRHVYSHARYGAEPYEPRADCDWRIEAPSGRVVRLSFLTFQLEAEDDCGYDHVEVFGGLDASGGPSYGRFCGNDPPKDIISLSEALIVRLRTDDSVNFKGFSASYVAIEPNYEETDDDEEEMAAVISPHQQTAAPSWTYRIQPYIQQRHEKHNYYNLRH